MKVVRVLFWASFVVMYLAVFGVLNERVREACTAAACKHGWYSKFNGTEKAEAIGWLVLSPVAAAGIYWLVLSTFRVSHGCGAPISDSRL